MNTRDRIAHYLRQLAPHVREREAAQLLEAALVTIDRLQVAADASRHYAMRYLQDERDEPNLCYDYQHHADVVAVWDALDGLPSNAELRGASQLAGAASRSNAGLGEEG